VTLNKIVIVRHHFKKKKVSFFTWLIWVLKNILTEEIVLLCLVKGRDWSTSN